MKDCLFGYCHNTYCCVWSVQCTLCYTERQEKYTWLPIKKFVKTR